ncbi:MAG: hypothetical protein AB7H71_01830, partial [Alphaproteobacteria bacterium]
MASSGCDFVTGTALVLTVVGWSMLWARALGLTPLLPIWLPPLAFFLGLALIPFGRARRRNSGETSKRR